ncbi:phosphoprotein phosphatase-like protein [Thozetella sp. PMI_491]|nr:phosphoprotein phosphatase-like protein [Thozetella sp. PMI_491]
MATIGSLQRLSATAVSKMILEQSTSPTFAIVDVRDDDYIGGHIKGSRNIPSGQLDAMLPTLVRQLQGKETVIFHCALSQQRGPGAALKYIRERAKMLPTLDKPATTSSTAAGNAKDATDHQKVYVLDRGFVGWQEQFAEDERLTEGYRKELWEDGYWG